MSLLFCHFRHFNLFTSSLRSQSCSCGCGIFTTSANRETKDERAVSRSASSPVRLPMMPATLLFTSWAIIRMTRS